MIPTHIPALKIPPIRSQDVRVVASTIAKIHNVDCLMFVFCGVLCKSFAGYETQRKVKGERRFFYRQERRAPRDRKRKRERKRKRNRNRSRNSMWGGICFLHFDY